MSCKPSGALASADGRTEVIQNPDMGPRMVIRPELKSQSHRPSISTVSISERSLHLRDNGHKSFVGHVKVCTFLCNCGLKFERHQPRIFRPDLSILAEPDLVFQWQPPSSEETIIVFVEVKVDNPKNRSKLKRQCERLAKMGGDHCVLGFLYVGRWFELFVMYGSLCGNLCRVLNSMGLRYSPAFRSSLK